MYGQEEIGIRLPGDGNAVAKPDKDVAALPILCRGAALRFLLTRLFDWLNEVDGALVRPKDPLEYADKLRFHQSAVSAESYGLS